MENKRPLFISFGPLPSTAPTLRAPDLDSFAPLMLARAPRLPEAPVHTILSSLDLAQGHQHLLSAGLIDLDATFWVQLGIFLALLFAMKAIAYDPFLKVAASRHDATEGARDTASAASAKAKELGEKVDEQISEARSKGVTLRNELKHSGEQQAQAQLAKVRDELEAKTHSELAELNAARAGASAALGTETRRLGDMIADRILGGAS